MPGKKAMAMSSSAIIGWYGPLIDLSDASSHIDDFVQLIVFVYSSHDQPQSLQKQYYSNGGTFLRTNIQVGDDTGSYFSVSIRQKHMESMIHAGDIILLQNVKIVKFKNVLEAATMQISSLLVLVHSCEFDGSKAIDELVPHGLLRETSYSKLRMVVDWVRHTESALRLVQKLDSSHVQGKTIKNWKTYKENKFVERLSVSDVLRLTKACHAKLHGCIGEIFMPFFSRPDGLADEEILVSKRLMTTIKNTIVEDLICQGCKLCGSPILTSSIWEQMELSLYCKKGFNYHHEICWIYRPFLMYVWDKGGEIPVMVKNKAAEMLFGNINAGDVYKCYQGVNQMHDLKHQYHSHPARSCNIEAGGSYCLMHENKNVGSLEAEHARPRTNPDFYRIWLILVKTLLQHDMNSPFCFEITVDGDTDIEHGRFELVSFTMPCYESSKS